MPPRPGCRLRSGPPGGRYLMYFAPCGGQAFSTALALYSVDIHELSVVVVVGIVTKMPPPHHKQANKSKLSILSIFK